MERRYLKSLLLILLCVTIPVSLFCQKDNNRGIPPAKEKKVKLWGTTYALVVGISYYKNLEPLNYADDDARSIRDYLLDSKIVRKENMYDRIDSSATRSNFFADLRKIYDKIRPDSNDRVIIYFAGHGDNESHTGQGYLLAYDCEQASYASSDAIFIPQLEAEVNALSEKAKVILITDACRSGNLAGQKAGALLTMRMLNTGFSGITKILSCEEDQLSQEKDFPGGGHGVFTYYLLEALEGISVPDSAKYISLSKIEDYVKKNVYENTKEKQRPVVYGPSSEIITTVDPELRQAVIAGKRNGPGVEMTKRAVSGLNYKLSPSDSVYYNLFYNQLRARQLNTPKGNNAYETYKTAKKKITNTEMLNSMKYDLAARLEDAVQPLLNQFIRGEFQDYPDTLFHDANEKLKIVQDELIDSSDFRFNEIKAKRIFFIASVFKTSHALQLLHEADLLMPNTAFINFEIGRYYSEKQNATDSALKYFNKAIFLSPRWSYPRFMTGNIYYQNKEYDRALTFFLQAIDLQPKFAFALFNLAMTYKQLKKKDSAGYYYDQALSLNKNFAQNQASDRKSGDEIVSLGKQLRKAGIEDENMLAGLLPPGLKNSDADHEAHSDAKQAYDFYIRAYNNSQSGNKDSAGYLFQKSIALFEKAKKENNLPLSYLYTLGYAYQSVDNNKKAKEIYELGLKTDTTDFHLYDFGIAMIEDQEGHTSGALEWYRKAIKHNPQYYRAMNNTGWIFARMKEYDSAILYYQKALQLSPDFTITLSNLGNIYFTLYKDDSAIFYFKKLDALLPKSEGNVFNKIGLSYYSLNSYDSAIVYYNKAILANDQEPYYFHNRGEAYFQSRQYQNAINDFEHSNTMFPDSAREYFNLALSYSYLENYTKAADVFKQSINKEKNIKDLYLRYYNLGWVMDKLGDSKSSLEWYQKSVEANPHYAGSLNNLAFTYDKLSKSDSAIYWYKRTLKVDPEYTRAISNLASIYNDMYQFDSSLVYYKLLLPLTPENANTPYAIGQLYYYKAKNDSVPAKDKYDSSIVYYNKAIQMDPLKANYWSKAGDVYFDIPKFTHRDTMELYQKAIDYYQKAIQLDSTQFLSMNRLGISFIYTARSQAAIDVFKLALRKDIMYKSTYEYNLGYLYDRMSKPDSANYWYHKTLATDPSFTNALYNLFINYYRLLQSDSVLWYGKILMPLVPTDAAIPFLLGQTHFNMAAKDPDGKSMHYDSAVVYYKKAILLKPSNATYQSKAGDAYYYLATSPRHQNDPALFQKAIVYYKEALRLDSSELPDMNNLGLCYIYTEKFNEAIGVFEAALKKDTANKNLYEYNLACVYSRQNVTDKALQYFERSIRSGFEDLSHISEDTDLDNIRGVAGFKTIIEKYFKTEEINKYPGLYRKKN